MQFRSILIAHSFDHDHAISVDRDHGFRSIVVISSGVLLVPDVQKVTLRKQCVFKGLSHGTYIEVTGLSALGASLPDSGCPG